MLIDTKPETRNSKLKTIMSINFKDPFTIFLIIIAAIILFARILPMFFSIASSLFWIAVFAAILLYVYPPTRGIIEGIFRKIFK